MTKKNKMTLEGLYEIVCEYYQTGDNDIVSYNEDYEPFLEVLRDLEGWEIFDLVEMFTAYVEEKARKDIEVTYRKLPEYYTRDLKAEVKRRRK